MSIWEFSGYEPYFMLYDHFIGDPNCIHMVVFSAADPQDVQMTQLLFWLNFIKARMQPMEPIGKRCPSNGNDASSFNPQFRTNSISV